MSKRVIEKGVPIPRSRRRGFFAEIEPLVTEMEQGDSVFFATESEEESNVLRCKLDSTVRAAAWRNRMEAGWSVRAVDGGVRFWRTR